MRDKPITNPDRQNEDPRYWAKVLKTHGLGMDRGKSANKVSLRGGINELVVVEKEEYEQESGRVRPSGHGPGKV